MEDFVYVLVMIALVLVTAAFVIGCDKIIGPDDQALSEQGREEGELDEPSREKVAA